MCKEGILGEYVYMCIVYCKLEGRNYNKSSREVPVLFVSIAVFQV
jgi:hypothetical protein